VSGIGRTLKTARIEAGLTLREAADAANMSKDTISRIERGEREPRDLTLGKLARVYGRTVSSMLDRPESPEEKAERQRREWIVMFENGYKEEAQHFLHSMTDEELKLISRACTDHWEYWIEILREEEEELGKPRPETYSATAEGSELGIVCRLILMQRHDVGFRQATAEETAEIIKAYSKKPEAAEVNA
jgi:transcriptional regulator with XRE-family HTH domain